MLIYICKGFGLVSLFNGISTLFRLFNAKAIHLEEQQWYNLTHNWEDKGVHTFPKGICPKVNVIARLEYELAYYDSAVHRFNHYTTRTPHLQRANEVNDVKRHEQKNIKKKAVQTKLNLYIKKYMKKEILQIF